MENLIIEKMAEKPEYIRTYLSNDMATIYVRNQLSLENQKRKAVDTFPVIKQKLISFKPIIKKQLKTLLYHDVLEIFLIIDPNGSSLCAAVLPYISNTSPLAVNRP